MELSFVNCFWLMFPILIWNIIFYKKLPQKEFRNNKKLSRTVVYLESFLRYIVFSIPLVLPIKFDALYLELGLLIYLIGLVLYFFTWIPLLFFSESKLSKSPIILMLPFASPIFPFIGIALISHSLIYGLISFVFISVHLYNGLLLFDLLDHKEKAKV